MDVFLINGNPVCMSTRPAGQINKPPVFQKPHKPKPTTKIAKKPLKKNQKLALPGINKTKQSIGKISATEETNLLVKLPSVESDDYKTPTSSSSSSDEDDFEEGEVDSEPLDQETSQAILSQEEESEGRFSGANSPW